MQQSIKNSTIVRESGTFKNDMSNSRDTCQKMIDSHLRAATKKVAEELYKEAFTLSFNGEWQAARDASQCAAHLLGTDHWNVEAKDLIQ